MTRLLSPFAISLWVAWLQIGISAADRPTYAATVQAWPPAASCLPRPEDQIWLISTRHVCQIPANCSLPGIVVQRFEGGSWISSTLDEFMASDAPAYTTAFYVHGNQIQASQAICDGLYVYQRLTACAPPAPLRFVIWSWPSQKMGHVLRDVRIKAARTDIDAFYLGCVLARMDPASQVSLIGYSFGARISTGALHLLGGGSLCGRPLPAPPLQGRAAVRVALLSPAVDNNWLLPGYRHGQAMTYVDRMVIFVNSCDRVLKRYHWIGTSSKQALGYTGLAAPWLLGAARQRIEQVQVCGVVGPQHDWANYFQAPSVVARIRSLVFSPSVGPSLTRRGADPSPDQGAMQTAAR